MRVTELRLSVGKTINLGNFNSLRIECGTTVSFEEGDDIARVKASMQDEMRLMLDETYRAQKRGES